PYPAVRGDARRGHRRRRRPHLHPGARARAGGRRAAGERSVMRSTAIERTEPPPSSRHRLEAVRELPSSEAASPNRGRKRPLFDGPIVRRAIVDSFRKLDPRHQIRNPVMFVVEVGSAFTTVLFLQSITGHGEASPGFILSISLSLWFTVL